MTRTCLAAAGQPHSGHSPQVLYAEQWGLEPCALPMVVNVAAAHCDTLDFSPLDESSSLIFYNVSKQPRAGRHQEARVLQAGTPLGLMAYLYSRCGWGPGHHQPQSPGGREQRGLQRGSGRSRRPPPKKSFPPELWVHLLAATCVLGQAPGLSSLRAAGHEPVGRRGTPAGTLGKGLD